MNMFGGRLKTSTSKHFQTNVSTEIINLIVANFLRCYCNYHQTKLTNHLPAAENSHNSTTIENMRMIPFKANLEWQPASSPEMFRNNPKPTVQYVADFNAPLAFSIFDAKFAMKSYKCANPHRTKNVTPRHATPSVTKCF